MLGGENLSFPTSTGRGYRISSVEMSRRHAGLVPCFMSPHGLVHRGHRRQYESVNAFWLFRQISELIVALRSGLCPGPRSSTAPRKVWASGARV